MNKLRLGVIGAGAWSVASHLSYLEERRDEVDFVGVNRRDPVLLEQVREKFGFSVASPDYHEILRHDLDICVIGSPVKWHHEHAKAALLSGAHVLVEKPFTIDPADAWDLVETADRVGRHLVVALGWHYRPMLRKAKELCETDGGIGEVEQVLVSMASTLREIYLGTKILPFAADQAHAENIVSKAAADSDLLVSRAESLIDPNVAGGGYAQAQLSHAIGMAVWLTGLRGKRVFAFMAPAGERIELHDACAVEFDGGAVGAIWGGSSHMWAANNRHLLEIRAVGSRGQLHLDLERERLWRYRGQADNLDVPLQDGDGLYNCRGPVEALVDLALGRPVRNESPGWVAARTVEITDAAYRSASTGLPAAIEAG